MDETINENNVNVETTDTNKGIFEQILKRNYK